MTALPQTNAHVTALVSPDGTSEDYDHEASSGTVKWTGRSSVYYRESRQRLVGPEGVNFAVVRTLIVPDGAFDSQVVARGDRITISTGSGSVSGTADVLEARAVPGVQGATRVTLEESQA